MTAVRGLLAAASRTLTQASESPVLDAQALLAHVLGHDRGWLFAWPEQEPTPEERDAFDALVRRRQQGEPIAYLTGEREFWSLRLRVSPATLIPRPETEQLVETLLAQTLEADAQVLDLGTGSGAIALALASERPGWTITATDYSAAALAVARQNAQRLQLSNVHFFEGDWFEALPRGRRFAAVVSNPPYVAEQDDHLARGDLRFEPRTALASGQDGLDAMRHLISRAPRHLEAGGCLWLEHGADQGPEVRQLLCGAGFSAVTTQRDTAGLERCSGGDCERQATAAKPP
jgi:release factor glutamine methyltransferase